MKPRQGRKRGQNPETDLMLDILEAVGSRPDVRLWRQNVGKAFRRDREGAIAGVVAFGFPGQADLSGILRDGRRLELEVKMPGEEANSDQARFGAVIERFGGVWAVVHSVAAAHAVVDRALEGGHGRSV